LKTPALHDDDRCGQPEYVVVTNENKIHKIGIAVFIG
jgi:hypothetical protein